MQSLLARVTSADIVEEPFPHVVVREPLDAAVCQQLTEEFPSVEVMSRGKARGSNTRLNYHAFETLGDERLSPLWRDLVATHVSQTFLDQLLGLFAEHIQRTYPSLLKSLGEGAPPRAGLRYVDNFKTADVLLEAQAAANTPVTVAPSSVRSAHLDNPDKLIVGLYYLRHPGDDAIGGDLEFYRYTTPNPEFEGHEVPGRFVEWTKSIPYERNVLVLFLNTPNSLHGVSVRQPTSWIRTFLNLGAEVEGNLFTIPSGRSGLPVINERLTDSERGRTLRPRPAKRVTPSRLRHGRGLARRQAPVLFALTGVAGFALTAALVEAFTDRDWSLSGLEWPADLLTSALLVCLVALGFAAAKALVRRRADHRRTSGATKA